MVIVGIRWAFGSLVAWLFVWCLLWAFLVECLAFSDEFSQSIDACLWAEECCKLVVWRSFVDYIVALLVCLAFEHFVFTCL
jgi:hypothetical protein